LGRIASVHKASLAENTYVSSIEKRTWSKAIEKAGIGKIFPDYPIAEYGDSPDNKKNK
jgi:hypothetical protein